LQPLYCRTHVDGELNNPRVATTGWSVEVALPLAGLVVNKSAAIPPKAGDMWRINFSRVEWAVRVVDGAYWREPACQSCPTPGAATEDNWVWSPQGAIAMHRPERWGFLQFADGPVNGTAPVRSPEWTVRSVAMSLYFAQHAYAGNNSGAYTASIAALAPFASPTGSLDGTCTVTPVVDLAADALSFTATIDASDGSMTATITDRRLLQVTRHGG